jgi:hypothetical protein
VKLGQLCIGDKKRLETVLLRMKVNESLKSNTIPTKMKEKRRPNLETFQPIKCAKAEQT